ncbi:MAG: hypothetical protein ACF8NJ_03080 [Phycisphaerales bacterium JB038]
MPDQGSRWDGYRCLDCHYDLRGNVSNTCPECGHDLADGVFNPAEQLPQGQWLLVVVMPGLMMVGLALLGLGLPALLWIVGNALALQ